MMRFPLAVSVITAGAVLIAAQEPQRPTFRAGTQTVSVYATVVDATGRLVTDLTKDDFEVFDNGIRQDLALFANDLQPITIVVLLDRSASMERSFALERDAAEQFILALLPADRARLGSFSVRVQIDPPDFTSDHAELLRILHENLQPPGPTPLWNATSAAMTALAHEEGRRVVLVFTDGADSPGRPLGANMTFAQIRDRAQNDNLMFYGIGLADPCARPPAGTAPVSPTGQPRFQGRGVPVGGGRVPGGGPGRPGGPNGPQGPGRRPPVVFPPIGGGSFPGPTRPGRGPLFPPATGDEGSPRPCQGGKPDPDLKSLSDDGGGGYFELHNTDDLPSTFLRIADELHHQYMMAFRAKTLDGTVHKLEVTVRRPNLTARARKSYVASTER